MPYTAISHEDSRPTLICLRDLDGKSNRREHCTLAHTNGPQSNSSYVKNTVPSFKTPVPQVFLNIKGWLWCHSLCGKRL